MRVSDGNVLTSRKAALGWSSWLRTTKALGIIAFERDAWVKAMLGQDGAPDLMRYGAARLKAASGDRTDHRIPRMLLAPSRLRNGAVGFAAWFSSMSTRHLQRRKLAELELFAFTRTHSLR